MILVMTELPQLHRFSLHLSLPPQLTSHHPYLPGISSHLTRGKSDGFGYRTVCWEVNEYRESQCTLSLHLFVYTSSHRVINKALHYSVLPIPQVDRSNKPVSLLSATVGGRSGGLREVVVPVELMPKFMALAQANTLRNIETCGVLAGKLVSIGLFVSFIYSVSCWREKYEKSWK